MSEIIKVDTLPEPNADEVGKVYKTSEGTFTCCEVKIPVMKRIESFEDFKILIEEKGETLTFTEDRETEDARIETVVTASFKTYKYNDDEFYILDDVVYRKVDENYSKERPATNKDARGIYLLLEYMKSAYKWRPCAAVKHTSIEGE